MSERLKQGITRVEVIGPSGRALVCDPRGAGEPFEAEAHYQDGGRTLKVFISREPDYVASADGGTPSREWQPIASAPMTTEDVLVAYDAQNGARVTQGYRRFDSTGKVVDGQWCVDIGYVFPTHWMPLPAPPSGETPEAQE